jgi:RNA polymerase sigma factor (sigma-70 family)
VLLGSGSSIHQVRGMRGPVAEARPINGRSSLGNPIRSSTALLEAHIPGLRRFARALLRGDQEHADDLVQDGLERALSNWHRRRHEADLRGWVYTIVYSRFLTERRRQQRLSVHRRLTEFSDEGLPGVDGGQGWALAHRDHRSER